MTKPDADKGFDIIINGTPHHVTSDEVSFDQVVRYRVSRRRSRPTDQVHGEFL